MDKTKLFIFIVLLSGMTLPLFALNLALVNDYIPKEKFVAAGAGLNIIFGLGAIAGPIICSILMNFLGPNGFFVHLLIFFIIITCFGIFRMNIRKHEDNNQPRIKKLPDTNIKICSFYTIFLYQYLKKKKKHVPIFKIME